MVDLALLQSLSYVAAAIGVFIATLYYAMTLRAQQKIMRSTLETRQAQMFVQIYQQVISQGFIKAWNRIEDSSWTNYEVFQQYSKIRSEGNPSTL